MRHGRSERGRWVTHQVAGEDDLGALLEEELDGGDGGADAGVIGDLLGIIKRDVEVGAHEHLLPLQIRLAEGAHAPLRRHLSLPCTHAPPPVPTPRQARGGVSQTQTQTTTATTAHGAQTATDPAGGEGDSPDRIGGRRDRWRWWDGLGCDEV